ncbi:hypothetical protein M0R45_022818 [Rubus argutus]|uniref:Uncharacterized protein n=1 Tax=Rubus argutus TaxID=59490 RepID=A0AAW1XJ27_RUBAR
MPTGKLVLLACLVLLVAPIAAVDSKSGSSGEWHSLTKQNFSSQIRLHPHILLLVTLPWSGESRSLMKDVAKLVTDRAEEFSSLKLMVLHRNTEKVVANAIGAASDSEETTVLYYHHSLYFCSSFVNGLLSLLAKRKRNGTDHNGFVCSTISVVPMVHISILGIFWINFNSETNGTDWWKNNPKGIETAKMKCDVDNALGAVPWIGDLSSVNDSAASEDTENIRPGVAESFCTLEEYQKDQCSQLLVFEIPVSWLAVLYFAGCPSCSKIIKIEGDLSNALQMDSSVVKELEGDATLWIPLCQQTSHQYSYLWIDHLTCWRLE